MNIFLVVLATLNLPVYQVRGCGVKNVQCLTDTTYQFCFTVGTQIVLVDGVMTCSDGNVCNENDGTYVCMAGTATATTTTSATTATGPPANCTEAGKYPAETCNQYYECVAVLWWYELVLQTCGTNLSYNTTSQECVANGTCASTTTTETTTVITTTIAATGPPANCTEAGKYPAETCNQYYECVAVLWWFELVLQTCGTNLSYNTTSQECVANGTCASTTTTETTTVTTTTIVATGPPANCTEAGKYPAETCNQYYECVAVLWWFDLVLQTCGTNLSYNTTSQECVANGTCASTTTTETTTVTTTTTTVTGPPETCTQAGRYPADICNQYWECVSTLWWFDLVLQTCGTDQAYNSTSQECVANSTCII